MNTNDFALEQLENRLETLCINGVYVSICYKYVWGIRIPYLCRKYYWVCF